MAAEISNNEKMRVPKLRFKEFEGEWEEKRLGDISTFSKGKNIAKADITADGNLECIRYGELYTVYSEVIENIKSRTNLKAKDLVLSDNNDVIIPASGETQIDIATASCVLKSGVALGGDLNIIKSKANGVFLSYYLNSKRKIDIARLSQGISVVHLYSSQLKTLDLNLPSDVEQQKIASFLTAVDKKLAQLNKKKEALAHYKKGVMQGLFSQTLRFKDDDGKEFPDWEMVKLGSLTKIIAGGTPRTTISEYWNGEIRWMNSGELNLKKVYEVENRITELGLKKSSASLVPKHSILIGLAGQGKTRGTVAMNMVQLCTNQSVAAILPNESLIFPEYVFQNLDNRYDEIRRLSTGDGGRGGLNLKIIKSIKINLPSVIEQQKIASYLSALDAKIAVVAKQVEETAVFKKGLLQGMFV